MGNVTSWLAQYIYPEEQVLWQAAHSGDAPGLRTALAQLTPATRKHIEWQEPCSGHTALAEAALRGHSACVALLVEFGANTNAKDYRGNTPLHLACKKGRDNVVQYLLTVPSVFAFATNADALTPLDVVRSKILKDDEYPMRYERCLETLEKKFCIFSGWLYVEHENVLSMVSGISSLGSWKRRFCIVLERGAPDILELALFRMKAGGARPVCPKTVVLYHVASGMSMKTDGKWFNRKELAFTLRGSRRGPRQYDAAIEMDPLTFAAVDRTGYDAWTQFFQHQQHALQYRTAELYGPPVVRFDAPFDSSAAAAAAAMPAVMPSAGAAPMPPHDWRAAAPKATTTTTSETQEDADVRQAIWLSLQDARMHTSDAASSPPLPVSSAPNWDDDVDDVDDASTVATTNEVGATQAQAPASQLPPVVDFGRAPAFAAANTSIGECVICFDGPQAAVCVPCGHNALCMDCAEEILDTTCECPVCRQPIRELIKLFRV